MNLSTKGGYRTIFGELLTSLKTYHAIWSIAAIVSQYRAICGGALNPYILNQDILKNFIFQRTVPSRRRFPCLDGAFCVELP